jgi:hypothetical protein
MDALRQRQRWLDFQRWMLSGMQKAEIANAIDAYQALRAAGWDETRALAACEQWTRDTQNPSTPIEQTGQFVDMRVGGFGGLLAPFFGQPTVTADQLQGQWLKARRTKNWRRFAVFAAGVLASAAFSVALAALVRRMNKGMFQDDDEKKRQREAYNTASEALGETVAVVDPLAGRAADLAFPRLWRLTTGEHVQATKQWSDESLVGQVYNESQAVADGLTKWWEKEELTDADAERLMLSAHRSLGLILGLPTGGVEQAVRATAGATGNPIGVTEPKPKKIMPAPSTRKEAWGERKERRLTAPAH